MLLKETFCKFDTEKDCLMTYKSHAHFLQMWHFLQIEQTSKIFDNFGIWIMTKLKMQKITLPWTTIKLPQKLHCNKLHISKDSGVTPSFFNGMEFTTWKRQKLVLCQFSNWWYSSENKVSIKSSFVWTVKNSNQEIRN